MNIYLAVEYIRYKWKSKYRKGHGIHPPFAFDLVRNLFYEKNRYYFFDVIDQQRESLLKCKDKLEIVDFGAGSKKFHSNKRSISRLVQYNATSQIQGELISRLIVRFKSKNIIELGTSLGVGTLYLALPNSQSSVFTIEGSENLANQAREMFNINGVENVTCNVGLFKEELPKILGKIDNVDLVYFDGHHNYEATKEYFQMCLPYASEESLFIFDDIHWSVEMNHIWTEIVDHPEVSISFDLFHFGIAIMKKNVQKQHYIINWP